MAVKPDMISYFEARDIVLKNVPLMPFEEVELSRLGGRVLAEDLTAQVDSPSVNASLKDGYAVHSADLSGAGPDNPVSLSLIRFQGAGDPAGTELPRGAAVRLTTGAPLPPAADAVLAGEFAREEGGRILCFNDAGPGRNVLPQGIDVTKGRLMAAKGQRLNPALIGLLAAGGIDRARVYARPKVAVIGTGDEIILPGGPLSEGRLYASNIVETAAWLTEFGLTEVLSQVVPDRIEETINEVRTLTGQVDAFITSGGAWGSERDLMLRIMKKLGWQGLFSRVRLGPGKAISFGLYEGRPVFILPGGPPSHEAAFLLLALPGLLAMSGWRGPIFPRLRAKAVEKMEGRDDWTQCLHAEVFFEKEEWLVRQVKSASRLSSMAVKNSLILLPEGVSSIEKGQTVEV
ncbi:MAG: molybdopterin molybdotransferase MoeA, partial [Pseudomonadota bacterium]